MKNKLYQENTGFRSIRSKLSLNLGRFREMLWKNNSNCENRAVLRLGKMKHGQFLTEIQAQNFLKC